MVVLPGPSSVPQRPKMEIQNPPAHVPWAMAFRALYSPFPRGGVYPSPKPLPGHPHCPARSFSIVFDRFRSSSISPRDLWISPKTRQTAVQKSAPPFFTAPGRYFRVHCSMLTPKRPQRGLKRWPRSTPSIAKIGTPSRREAIFP